MLVVNPPDGSQISDLTLARQELGARKQRSRPRTCYFSSRIPTGFFGTYLVPACGLAGSCLPTCGCKSLGWRSPKACAAWLSSMAFSAKV